MRLRFPHPLVLLVACGALAALGSWILPAGEFERRADAATGRDVVVAGTYHRVDPQPVNAFEAVVAIPRGIVDAASVIGFVFLVGGAFAIVEKTGALERVVNWLVAKLSRRSVLVIPICCIAFAAGGALMHMAEELIAFVPVLLLLVRRFGYTRVTAVAMSIGAAAVGAAFSPVDPFMVGIAQQVAGLPLLSGTNFRLIFLAIALAFWIFALARYAEKNRLDPETSPVGSATHLELRHTVILLLVIAAFALLILGVNEWGWGFDELSAVFLTMGVVAGVIGGLRINGTAEALVDGFRAMAYSALLIGFARAIYIVMDQGKIIDTVVHGVFVPIENLPVALSATGMMVAQTLVHFAVPSTSGQAVLTLPVLVPLSDLIGLARQVTVLAYQYGAGLCELLTPTNGALMAMLGAAGVSYGDWLRFFLPRYAVLLGVAVVALLIAISIGLS
ncbi:MAG TPA: Na+/H+ antiporter NhaC family protein [Longimicrobiales bacterium]|nr:Na+/H+ antiporter NhaC family protein [Longimicrobiales bacterium]